jgi:hypothetical protein
VANAGTAQNTVTGTTVTLDGSGSSDANGDALTYAWTLTSKPAGSAASLINPTSPKPTFQADVAGTYVASLVVNDGKVSSQAGTVTVTATVANAAPVANAGTAQNTVTGTTVTLDGSGSSDANGDALTYAWTLTSKPAGSTAALSSTTSAKPTFKADVAGTYVASLVVNDGQVNSASATATVTAISPSINLYNADKFFGESLASLPYSASANQNASCLGTCSAGVTVGTFKLVASGGSFTIVGLSAVNLSSGSSVIPSFSGLVNNQVISSGQAVTFNLISGLTGGATVNMRYSFTILETRQTFIYNVGLKTN